MLKLLRNFKIIDWMLVLLSFVFILCQVWLELKIPDFMQEITVLVQTNSIEMKDILINGGYMLLCAFGSLFFTVLVGYIVAYLSSIFLLELEKEYLNILRILA